MVSSKPALEGACLTNAPPLPPPGRPWPFPASPMSDGFSSWRTLEIRRFRTTARSCWNTRRSTAVSRSVSAPFFPPHHPVLGSASVSGRAEAFRRARQPSPGRVKASVLGQGALSSGPWACLGSRGPGFRGSGSYAGLVDVTEQTPPYSEMQEEGGLEEGCRAGIFPSLWCKRGQFWWSPDTPRGQPRKPRPERRRVQCRMRSYPRVLMSA